jgi:hypothetical protein
LICWSRQWWEIRRKIWRSSNSCPRCQSLRMRSATWSPSAMSLYPWIGRLPTSRPSARQMNRLHHSRIKLRGMSRARDPTWVRLPTMLHPTVVSTFSLLCQAVISAVKSISRPWSLAKGRHRRGRTATSWSRSNLKSWILISQRWWAR